MRNGQSRTEIDDCASVWFAILERAHNLSDHEQAADAIRELRRLGWEVRFMANGKHRTNGQARPHVAAVKGPG